MLLAAYTRISGQIGERTNMNGLWQQRHKTSHHGLGPTVGVWSPRSAFTRWTKLALVLGLVVLGGTVAGHDTPPPYGFGAWINVSSAPALCGPVIDQLCAEFEDGLGPNSPHHGMFCCVHATEIGLGRFSSCLRLLGENPRED